MKRHRLPRRVHLGRGYVVEVALASQRLLRDILDADDDQHFNGAWDSALGEPDESVAGRIYVYQGLSAADRWATYWHELLHAVNDIRDWDAQTRGEST
jgi:hypothetical protein